jgi:hydrogenase 3 maturation protease
MQTLPTLLKKNLNNARALVVVGMGSELRADDVAGILVAENLKRTLSAKPRHIPVTVLNGGTAPENLTGEIRKISPSHVLFVDAAEMGKKPGAVALFSPEDDLCGISFTTHQLPIKIMADYLRQSFQCIVSIIGIQPKTIEFGKKPTRSVIASANKTAFLIKSVISKLR